MHKKRKFADGGSTTTGVPTTTHFATKEPCGVENECNPNSVFPPEIQAKIRNLQKDLDAKAEAQRSASKAKSNMVKGKGMNKGGKVKSASSRADGIAQRGKTRGKYC